MMRQLPTFRGYTVDVRLREFRRVVRDAEEPRLEFIPFTSPEGDNLLAELIETLEPENPLLQELVEVL